MAMNRPVGVTIIAVLQFILNLLGLLGGCTALLARDVFDQALSKNGQSLPGGSSVFAIIGVVVIVFSLLGIVLAWGLFTLKSWAWLLTLIFQGLSILSSLSNVLRGPNAGGAVFSVVISGVIIYYLLRPEVKRAFGKV